MINYQKVETIKRPLKLGEKYLVPCIVRKEEYQGGFIDDGFGYMAPNYKTRTYITPVINHPHSDRENGQNYVHYHVDFRFIKTENGRVVNNHSNHFFVESARPQDHIHGEIEYVVLPVVNEQFDGITSVEHIKNSKLKHKCIHKGKCPHRGYDLSQVPSVDGIITCPLHGLKFDSETKVLLNENKTTKEST